MSTDYRALCAELVAALDPKVVGKDGYGPIAALLPRARAALAQPEPVAPTDEELLEMWHSSDWFNEGATLREFISIARAVLAKWGNSQGILDSSPQPEPVAPTDEEIEEWADASSEVPLEEMDPDIHGWRRCFTKEEFGASIRAALTRWGTPAIQPVPVSERLPGADDCDAEGRCWWHRYTPTKEWHLQRLRTGQYNHWLPHWALPVTGVGGCR